MREYVCHKRVKAARVVGPIGPEVDGMCDVPCEDGTRVADAAVFARGVAQPGDYLVQYEDGYVSWSPRKAFEDGYTLAEAPAPAAINSDADDDGA
jgi:hypothetical protein